MEQLLLKGGTPLHLLTFCNLVHILIHRNNSLNSAPIILIMRYLTIIRLNKSKTFLFLRLSNSCLTDNSVLFFRNITPMRNFF